MKGVGGKKIGNAHLKWAFREAACLMLRAVPAVKAWMQRQEKKRGKRKALSILEAKIGRTVYHLWRKQSAVRREAVPERAERAEDQNPWRREETHERSLMGCDHRPGPGSCTPNWGTTATAISTTFS